MEPVKGSEWMAKHYEDAVVETHSGYGEKSSYRKITVTLPPETYEKLIQESARRKIAGQSNHLLSALLREAVTDYLLRLL